MMKRINYLFQRFGIIRIELREVSLQEDDSRYFLYRFSSTVRLCRIASIGILDAWLFRKIRTQHHLTRLSLDNVKFMNYCNPLRFLQWLSACGADLLNIHNSSLERTMSRKFIVDYGQSVNNPSLGAGTFPREYEEIDVCDRFRTSHSDTFQILCLDRATLEVVANYEDFLMPYVKVNAEWIMEAIVVSILYIQNSFLFWLWYFTEKHKCYFRKDFAKIVMAGGISNYQESSLKRISIVLNQTLRFEREKIYENN